MYRKGTKLIQNVRNHVSSCHRNVEYLLLIVGFEKILFLSYSGGPDVPIVVWYEFLRIITVAKYAKISTTQKFVHIQYFLKSDF